MTKADVGFESVRDMVPNLASAPFLHEFLHYINDLRSGTVSLLPSLGAVIPFMEYELNCRGFRKTTWDGHAPVPFQTGSLVLADSGDGKTTGVALYKKVHHQMRVLSGAVSITPGTQDLTHPGVVPFKSTEAGAFTFAKARYVDPEDPATHDLPPDIERGVSPFILYTDEATALFRKMVAGSDGLSEFFNDVMTGSNYEKGTQKMYQDWDGEGVPIFRLVNPCCSSLFMAPLSAVTLGGFFDAATAVSGFLGRQLVFLSTEADYTANIAHLEQMLSGSMEDIEAREAQLRQAREADQESMANTLGTWVDGLAQRARAGNRLIGFTPHGHRAMAEQRLWTSRQIQRIAQLPDSVGKTVQNLFLKRVDVHVATIAGFYATLNATPVRDTPFMADASHVLPAAKLVMGRYECLVELLHKGILDGKSVDPQRDRLRERILDRLLAEKAAGNKVLKRRDLLQGANGKNRQVFENAIDDLTDAEQVLTYDNKRKGRGSVRLVALASEADFFVAHLKAEYGVAYEDIVADPTAEGQAREAEAAQKERYEARRGQLLELGLTNKKGVLTFSMYQKIEALVEASLDGHFEWQGKQVEWPFEWCSPQQRHARNPLS